MNFHFPEQLFFDYLAGLFVVIDGYFTNSALTLSIA